MQLAPQRWWTSGVPAVGKPVIQLLASFVEAIGTNLGILFPHFHPQNVQKSKSHQTFETTTVHFSHPLSHHEQRKSLPLSYPDPLPCVPFVSVVTSVHIYPFALYLWSTSFLIVESYRYRQYRHCASYLIRSGRISVDSVDLAGSCVTIGSAKLLLTSSPDQIKCKHVSAVRSCPENVCELILKVLPCLRQSYCRKTIEISL